MCVCVCVQFKAVYGVALTNPHHHPTVGDLLTEMRALYAGGTV